MPNKIQFKRGLEANLPSLVEGEPGFTTDSKKLFVGSNTGNVQFAKQSAVDGIQQTLDNLKTVDANAEVLDARGTYPLLGQRLNDVTSQLADIVTVNFKNYATFEAAIAALPSGGDIFFPKGTYTRSTKLNVPENICFVSNGDAYVNGPIRLHQAENIYINNLYREKRSDHMYNRKAFSRFKKYLLKAETELVNVVCLGDSITYGQVSTDEQHLSWAGLLRTFLTEQYGNGGFGYLYSAGGAITKEGTNLKTLKLGSGANGSSGLGTAKFNKLEVIKGKNTDGGTMNITIDGVSYPVNCSGTAREYGVHEVVFTDTSAKDHTLQVLQPSTGLGYFEGLVFYNDTKGIILHQMGYVGIRANEYGDSSIQASITRFNPRLTVIALGMNDFIQQTSISEYRTAIEKMIIEGKKNDGTVVLLSYQDSNDGSSTQSLSGHYFQQLSELAAQYDCVVVDIDKKWINVATAHSNGFNDDVNGVHPYNIGHKDIFESFKSLFSDYQSGKKYAGSYLTVNAEKTLYINQREKSMNDLIMGLYKNFDYSSYGIEKTTFTDGNADGLDDQFIQSNWGNPTGNTFTPSIVSGKQKFVMNITSLNGGQHLQYSPVGLVSGNEYFVIIKTSNVSGSANLQVIDTISGSGQVSSTSSTTEIYFKRTCSDVNGNIKITKDFAATGTYSFTIEGIGLYNLTKIKADFPLDFNTMTNQELFDLLKKSL